MKIRALSVFDIFRGEPKRIERPASDNAMLPPEETFYPTGFDIGEYESVIYAASQGDIGALWRFYERMEYSDPFLGGLIQHLISAVSQVPTRRVHRDEDSIAARYEQKLSKTFDILDLRHYIALAARAYLQGAAIIKIDWATYERDGTVFAYPKKMVHVPFSSVKMVMDATSPHYGELALMDESGKIVPVSKLPPQFYVVVKAGEFDGKWNTSGALRKVMPWWATKQFAHRQWLHYIETYGMPYRVGYLPPGATPEVVAEMKKALNQLGSFAWAVLRPGAEIDFKEASHPPTVEVYRTIIDYAHKQYAVALIGSADVVGDNREGSYARLKISNSIRYEFVRNVAAIVEDALTLLAARCVAVNIGSDYDPLHVPKVKLRVLPPTDQVDLANVVRTLSDVIEIPDDYIRELFNIPKK